MRFGLKTQIAAAAVGALLLASTGIGCAAKQPEDGMAARVEAAANKAEMAANKAEAAARSASESAQRADAAAQRADAMFKHSTRK